MSLIIAAMDNHSELRPTVLLYALILSCSLCSDCRAAAKYTYGRAGNAVIGSEHKVTETNLGVFVPRAGRLLDVDLAINISHPSVCDLQIYLISPAGTTVDLNYYDVYDFKADQQDYKWTIFDDDAAIPIQKGIAPFEGVFRPKLTPLSIFNQENPYGLWQVKVVDSVFADSGIFRGARLDLFINPEPDTIGILLAGALFVFSRTAKRLFWL